jgi:hypothetical protein
MEWMEGKVTVRPTTGGVSPSVLCKLGTFNVQYFHTSSLFSGFSVANVSSIIWFPLKFHTQRLAKLSQCLQTIVKQQTRKKDKLDYNISILDAVVL